MLHLPSVIPHYRQLAMPHKLQLLLTNVKLAKNFEQAFDILQYSQPFIEHSMQEVFVTSENEELQEEQTLLDVQVLYEEILQVKH